MIDPVKLAALREKAGLGQAALAKNAGLARQTVARFEQTQLDHQRRGSAPSLQTITALQRALGEALGREVGIWEFTIREPESST